MQLNSCSADAPAQRMPIEEKLIQQEIPFTGFTQKHTEAFGATSVLDGDRCDVRGKQVNV